MPNCPSTYYYLRGLNGIYKVSMFSSASWPYSITSAVRVEGTRHGHFQIPVFEEILEHIITKPVISKLIRPLIVPPQINANGLTPHTSARVAICNGSRRTTPRTEHRPQQGYGSASPESRDYAWNMYAMVLHPQHRASGAFNTGVI